MSDILMFFYALLGVFVLASMDRNVKQQRPHSRMLTAVGWSMMSTSASLGLLLAAYAAYLVLMP